MVLDCISILEEFITFIMNIFTIMGARIINNCQNFISIIRLMNIFIRAKLTTFNSIIIALSISFTFFIAFFIFEFLINDLILVKIYQPPVLGYLFEFI